MSGVITVRIPDDLEKRLEPLKGRLNVSDVCRVALEAKAKTHEAIERALSEEDVMKGLIERLRVQKAEALDRSYAQGREDGQNWAIRDATYEQLDRWGERVERYRPARNVEEADSSYTFSSDGDPLIKLEFPEERTAQVYLDSRRDSAGRDNHVLERRVYNLGFLDAVCELWNKVKDEL